MNVLIVEDEEKMVQHLEKGFKQEGYTVYSCLNGEEAEEYIDQYSESLDVIILDDMLPGKRGLDVCRSIRKKHITTPILMLTAKDSSEDIIAGLDGGIDDYLTKPFAFEILLAHVRALLRRPKERVYLSQTITIGSLTLDTLKREVWYKGKKINFTLKEFNLLAYLMKHPNEVLEREDLLEKIWDFNFDTFSNVVDVHIKNIRKKLREVHNEEILETVHGVGYKIKTRSIPTSTS